MSVSSEKSSGIEEESVVEVVVPPAAVSVPPPPPPDDDEEEVSPSGSPGSGVNVVAVVLGVCAFVALLVGLQANKKMGAAQLAIDKQKIALAEATDRRKQVQAELDEASTLEKTLQELQARGESQREEINSLRQQEVSLQRYRNGGSVADDLAALEQRKARLRESIARTQAMLEMYLPPERLPEEKLIARDEFLRKQVRVYVRSLQIGLIQVPRCMCANYLVHSLTGERRVSSSRVAEAISKRFEKRQGGISEFKLKALGYKGTCVEFIVEQNQTDYSTSPVTSRTVYCKESWKLDENGLICHQSEAVSDTKPEISAGFRNVNLERKK